MKPIGVIVILHRAVIYTAHEQSGNRLVICIHRTSFVISPNTTAGAIGTSFHLNCIERPVLKYCHLRGVCPKCIMGIAACRAGIPIRYR